LAVLSSEHVNCQLSANWYFYKSHSGYDLMMLQNTSNYTT